MPETNISVKFRVSDDGTLRVFDEAGRKLADVGRQADIANQRATAAFSSMERTAKGAAVAVTALGVAASAVGVKSIGAAAEVEALQTRLVNLRGSAEAARLAETNS